MFDEIISDTHTLCNRYIEREGFIFTSLTHPRNVYDAIVLKNIKSEKGLFRGFPNPQRSFEDHIQFINDNLIEKAVIFSDDISFLEKVPTLMYLEIVLKEDAIIDFSVLYKFPEIKSLTVYQEGREDLLAELDYSKIRGLQDIHISGKSHIGFENIDTLKSLTITGYKGKHLKDLFDSKRLDTLCLFNSKIESLLGIDNSDCVQCVYLYYNRYLVNIDNLKSVKNTLRTLIIENCSKIKDFSVLSELDNLEFLKIIGSNSIPDLNFIKDMKNLKTFIFDINIEDGDLTPCLKLSYVCSKKNRKHYNLKNFDLPKDIFVQGNEDIELWRQME